VNTGDAKAKISLYNAGDVNLTAPVTISFGPTANEYSVSGPAGTQTGLPYIPGQPIAMNGWSMSLTGKPNVGDSFRVGANPSPGTDNTNAKAMVGLVDAKTVNGATFNDAYAEFLADVGLRGQNAELNRTFSEQSFSYAKAANDEVSGVNLDEEAAKMIQYQQAYQAAAKFVSTVQSLFDAVLRLGG
jgi:flagellar hook-associated protein 1 FlgK